MICSARIFWLRLRWGVARLLKFPRAPIKFLWSKGWYLAADWSGNSNLWYPALPTRYRVKSLRRLRGKQGVIWIRLGSDPPKPEFDNGNPGDVQLFSQQVIGRLGGPVVLVTTDGDRSIPSGLPGGVAESILKDPNIVAWYSQNLDDSFVSGKLKAVPIGLDLHTMPGSKFTRPEVKAEHFQKALRRAKPLAGRTKRIWSDVHLEPNLGNLVGIARGTLTEARDELREAFESNKLLDFLDQPEQRLPETEIWSKYGSYAFVVSLPGHGLDCHRTWEALALGSIVITIHSPLDELLRPYRVVFLPRQDNHWWLPLGDQDWLENAFQTGKEGRSVDLSFYYWSSMVRAQLTASDNRRSVV